MSNLISEAYANLTSPLWESEDMITAPSVLIGTQGTQNTNQYNLLGGLAHYIYNTNQLTFVAGMYIATISVDVDLVGQGRSLGGQNLALYFTLEVNNSVGQFVSGSEYYYDITQGEEQQSRITLQLPFASSGDGSDTLDVAIQSGYDYDYAVWNITTYSESIQFITPTPTIVDTIFG